MHPIEHLRHVALDEAFDPALLAEDAAYGLAALSHDRRALLTACRRLLEFHPDCGPMWWTAAQVLAEESPDAAAQRAIELLRGDETAALLASSLATGAVIVSVLGSITAEALRDGPDLEVRLIGEGRPLRLATARLRSSHGPQVRRYSPDELEDALDGASLALIEALAAGSAGVLVSADAAALARAARAESVPCWTVLGEGRLLPSMLFDSLLERNEVRRSESDDRGFRPDDEVTEDQPRSTVLLEIAEIDRIISTRRSASPGGALSAATCPAPAELVGRARLG